MKTNYSVTNGGSASDFGDLFVPRSLFSQGGLWTWGPAGARLGEPTGTSKSSPVQTVAGGTNWKLTAGGKYHTVGIKSNGTLWLWGDVAYGKLGDPGATGGSSPIQTVSQGTNWKQVSCGEYHTAAVKTDGTLWTWGYNVFGQLGDSSNVDKSSPVQTVAGGATWNSVACGYSFTAAIKTDGTLWTWGSNSWNQLGDGSGLDNSSPVQTIAAGNTWKIVSCGDRFAGAIKSDGTLWTWGYNTIGQLGDNTRTARSSPVQTISQGTNWKSIACGREHAVAIKSDGTLWTWGNNGMGRLGDNTTVSKSSPVQTVAGGTNWKLISGAKYHTAAIKTDGTLWLWGSNSYGRLGDNTTVDKSSPVQTVAGGTNWKLISCGIYHNAAITDIF